MRPDAVGTFNRPLASVGVYKNICLDFKRIHKNVDKRYFFKSKNFEKNKILIWGIHYFITKLKTKIDIIPAALKCI